MDVFILEILLGYKKLPERAADLWVYMEKIRDEIAWEKSHKNREGAIAHKVSILSQHELEFRNILIAARREELAHTLKQEV